MEHNDIIEDNYAYNMYKLRWLETCECMSLHQVVLLIDCVPCIISTMIGNGY